jgi:hypothetical protein
LTFTITPTEHPFYLTSSILGGRLSYLDSGETILAGDQGLQSEQLVSRMFSRIPFPRILCLRFTNSVFVLLMHRSYDHQKLGWYIVEAGRDLAN